VLTICRRKVGVAPPDISGAKKLLHLFGFQRLLDLVANICGTKRDTDNWAMALESTKGLLHCPKISWTLVHKRLKTGPGFLPTLIILFCSSPLHTPYAAFMWCPTTALNETALGLSAAPVEAWKYINLEMLSCRAALSGNIHC